MWCNVMLVSILVIFLLSCCIIVVPVVDVLSDFETSIKEVIPSLKMYFTQIETIIVNGGFFIINVISYISVVITQGPVNHIDWVV